MRCQDVDVERAMPLTPARRATVLAEFLARAITRGEPMIRAAIEGAIEQERAALAEEYERAMEAEGVAKDTRKHIHHAVASIRAQTARMTSA